MGFEELLGNEQLKANLQSAVLKGRISHFYLIAGPRGSGKHTLAGLLSRAILCTGERKPCGTCPACRKMLHGSHPDFITVDDPEKKTVPVELIRQAREDMYIRPNEGAYKIYLFPRAHDMGLPGQNALLKVLEEPPEYGVFLLLTENPESLLPTVRSRCTQLSLHAVPEQVLCDALAKDYPDAQAVSAAVSRSGGYMGQAIELLQAEDAMAPQTLQFCEAYTEHDRVKLLQLLASMEKLKRDTIPIFCQWLELCQMGMLSKSGAPAPVQEARAIAAAHTSRGLKAAVEALTKAVTYAKANVGIPAVCGYLLWAIEL